MGSPLLSSVIEFVGHLHPVLVHLPIGILLLACLFIWQSKRLRFAYLQPVINIILLLGFISAVFSCITGYLLFSQGDYDDRLAHWHQWMGISVALLSGLTYLLRFKPSRLRWQGTMGLILLVLLFVTGHLGGSLTHGTDYLTQPLLAANTEVLPGPASRPVPDVQQALVYTDLVQPVLKTKCYDCHGGARQKGKLRLDQADLLLQGGKDGRVIVPGKADQSLLIKRILLSEDDEHHMPPTDRKQLTEEEKTLLQWWINQGPDFTEKVDNIYQPPAIRPVLLSFQRDSAQFYHAPLVPDTAVQKADDAAVRALTDKGVVILPVATKSNYLSANYVSAQDITDQDTRLLLPLSRQLVWLKMGHVPLTDSSLEIIGRCTHLTMLQLNNTLITDRGLTYLKNLAGLQTLNLVGTQVSLIGLKPLQGLKDLHSLYLYQTHISRADWPELKKMFPRTELDSGGYQVPLFSVDTQIVKPPPIKN